MLQPVLPTQPPNPGSLARFRRLMALMQTQRVASGETRGLVRIAPASDLTELEGILAEGPVERPLPKGSDDLADLYLIRATAKRLARDADFDLRAGRLDQAARRAKLIVRLNTRTREAVNCLLDQPSIVTLDAVMVGAINRLLPYLNESQMRQILRLIPREVGEDRTLEQAVRGEVARTFSPLLPDVYGYIGEKNLGEFIGQLKGSIDPARDERIGDYDPMATAELVREMAASAIDNARRRRTESDDSAVAHLRLLERSVPRDSFRNEESTMSNMERWTYKVSMRIRPNAFGELIVLGMWPRPTNFAFNAYRMRTEREILRGLLAITAYERHTGHLPKDFDTLVTENYLDALPFDHLGDRPLQYDPKRRIVWSVGRDALDDQGTCVNFENSSEKDWVWRLPPLATKG